MAKVYIEKHRNDVARVRNTLGRDAEGGEFVIIGRLSGAVDRNVGDGEYLGLQMEPFLEIQVGAADLETGSYEEHAPLYFSMGAGKFADGPGDLGGCVAVGQIAHNRLDGSGGGVITFFKYPLAGEESLSLSESRDAKD